MSATQTDVLNPTLYRALSRVFGEVRVSRAGESFEARVAADPETDRPRLTVVRHGESYRVCCPFCRDRGFNLNVNHRYGTVDDRLDRPLDFLAVCFSRGCLKDSSRRRSLFARLDGGADILSGARLRPGERAVAEPLQLPRGFRHLGRFGDEHPVCARLRDHGFDPLTLGREFGVGFCASSHEPLARDRVVAPVSQGGKFAGWIAARLAEGGVNFLRAGHAGRRGRLQPGPGEGVPGRRRRALSRLGVAAGGAVRGPAHGPGDRSVRANAHVRLPGEARRARHPGWV